MFAVAALTVVSALADVCLVTFRQSLSPPFVAHLEHTLKYSLVGQLVPPASALLYLNAQSRERLDAYALAIDCSPERRCASSFVSDDAAAAAAVTALPERVTFDGRHVAAATTALTPPPPQLLVTLHAGAFVNDYDTRRCCDELETMLDAHAMTYSMGELSPTLVLIDELSSSLDAAAHVLMSGECVSYIERYTAPHTLNVWSEPAVSNASLVDLSLANAGACSPVSCRPFASIGVTGASQLVGVSDTGLAASTCFFVDSSRAVPKTSSASSIPADTGHRRIRALWTFQDAVDGNGHGTHVCGSLAGVSARRDGSSALATDDFDGGSHARIVFADIGSGSSGSLSLPSLSTLLDFSWRAGARVQSSSWGGAKSYDSLARDADAYLYTHPDLVFVAAAGNSGSAGVLSPALAKNSLSVAASLPGVNAYTFSSSASKVYPDDVYARDWIADFSSSSTSSSPVPWLTPVVAAPGGRYIWSANAQATDGAACSLSANIIGYAGTSMATPALAGAATLVRDYFALARYNGTSIVASGPLVVATLLGGTAPTRGLYPGRTYASLGADSSATYAPYGHRRFQGQLGRLTPPQTPLPHTLCRQCSLIL